MIRPWASRSALASLLLLAYLVLTHAAVLTGATYLAQAAWLGLTGMMILAVPGKWGLAVGAALAGALLFADAETLLKFPPVVLDLVMAAWFGRSLAPGEEPIVSWFARLIRGVELPPDLARYTRNSTIVWTAFLAGLGGLSAGLALFATPQAWSLFANGVSYLLVGVLFAGEYVYRRVRYRHHEHAPFAEVVRTVIRAGRLSPRRTARK